MVDPCAAGGGTYNVQQGFCNCPLTPLGTQSINETSSFVGEICGNIIDYNNPCGNRGTPIPILIPGTNPPQYKVQCTNCNQPFSNTNDATNTCSTILDSSGSFCSSDSDCWSNICSVPSCSFFEHTYKDCFDKVCQ